MCIVTVLIHITNIMHMHNIWDWSVKIRQCNTEAIFHATWNFKHKLFLCHTACQKKPSPTQWSILRVFVYFFNSLIIFCSVSWIPWPQSYSRMKSYGCTLWLFKGPFCDPSMLILWHSSVDVEQSKLISKFQVNSEVGKGTFKGKIYLLT